MNVILVSVVASIAPGLSYNLLPEGFINFILTSTLAVISSCMSVFYVGCSKVERELIVCKSRQVINALKSKFGK